MIAAKGPIFLGKSCIFSFEYSGQPVSRLPAACERKKYILYKHRTANENFFKAYVHYFLSNFYFSPNDSPSKSVKNVFYFIEKALFVLEIFNFL